MYVEGAFAIPTTGSENEVWRMFHLNLSNQPNIPDVFFMAFRYVGPNGAQGVVTYYVDNISWGRTDLPTITPNVTSLVDSLAVLCRKATAIDEAQREKVQSTKVMENGVLYLMYKGRKYNVQGTRVR